MNLTELQAELREMEEKLSYLQSEVEKMKPRNENDRASEYSAIDRLAKRYPLTRNMIIDAPDKSVRELYLFSLAYFFEAAEDTNRPRLLYIRRICAGCAPDIDTAAIVKAAMSFSEEWLTRVQKELIKFKLPFITDAVVLAALVPSDKGSGLSVAADLAELLGCGTEVMKITAQVAKCVLTESAQPLRRLPPGLDIYRSFKGFISPRALAFERQCCCSICVDEMRSVNGARETVHPNVITGQLKQGTFVKKGDTILTCANRAVTAPADGAVYYMTSWNYSDSISKRIVVVYLASEFDDYDSISSWYAQLSSGKAT